MRRTPSRAFILIILVITAATVAVGYWLYGSPYARFGRQHGYDPPTFTVVRPIQERVANGQPLTAVDLVALRSLAGDENWAIRCRALSPLYAARGPAEM